MKFKPQEFAAPKSCLMRRVPNSFSDCLRMDGAEVDARKAQAQHLVLVETIRGLVDEVVVLEESEAHPDCCFIEDTAVLFDESILVTRPGAPSRQGEIDWLRKSLNRSLNVVELKEGTLDGGDVMRLGNLVFVGESSRTNQVGFECFARVVEAFGLQAVMVSVARGLHLKSACTVLDPETIVMFPGIVEKGQFEALGIRVMHVPEVFGANILPMGDKILVSEAAPETRDLLSMNGFETISVDVSELHKADGALTCLSLRRPESGFWCP